MMEDKMERFWLQVKAMKVLFFVPFIAYYCVIPLGVWAMSKGDDFYYDDALSEMCYLVVPFMCTWWLYLVLREYVEGDGREVLLLGKDALFSALMFLGLNVICIVPLFLIQQDAGMLVPELLIISIFMNGMTYFVAFYSKSITAAVFVVMLYSAFSNYSFINEQFEKILNPIQLQILRGGYFEENWSTYIGFLAAGVLFWFLGAVRSGRIE